MPVHLDLFRALHTTNFDIAITLGSVLVIIYRYMHYRNITAQTVYAYSVETFERITVIFCAY